MYAINDLAGFFGYADVDANLKKSDARILLLQEKVASHTAIFVDRLIGLRSSENLKKVVGTKKHDSQQFAHECFFDDEYEDEDGSHWRVLDCQALVNLKGFMQAGLV